MNPQHSTKDTGAWILFTWISFIVANTMMILGIYHAPVDMWVKGFFLMGLLFTIGSTFTLSKTIRDNAEAQSYVNRVVEAKNEQLMNNYEMRQI
ncbi:MAG: hypothetical protein H0T53_17650 [Herpetosiphonaceae bacterium]|nr:hypothetical protein [Herpetosiphonaceae bacterium]